MQIVEVNPLYLWLPIFIGGLVFLSLITLSILLVTRRIRIPNVLIHQSALPIKSVSGVKSQIVIRDQGMPKWMVITDFIYNFYLKADAFVRSYLERMGWDC